MSKCPRPWALAQTRGRLKRPGPWCREPARARGSPPPSWTFSTIGSPNGAAVDEIDDWESKFGPRMDVSDDWETFSVSQTICPATPRSA